MNTNNHEVSAPEIYNKDACIRCNSDDLSEVSRRLEAIKLINLSNKGLLNCVRKETDDGRA
jgi:hypothetical protein